MGFEIFHTVNCGLYIRSGDTAVLVDGLFDKIEGFSDTPTAIKEQLSEQTGMFSRLDAAIFTHRHPDHFSGELVDKLLKYREPPAIWWPGAEHSALRMEERSPGLCAANIGGIEFFALDTVHDGPQYRDVPHRSFLLRADGETMFIAGDAKLGLRESGLLSGFAPADTGFFMFYQLNSRAGRDFVRDMGFKNVMLYHMPMPEDDVFGYGRLAKRLPDRFPEGLPAPEIPAPMSWLNGKG
ncbi:MAG: MBL fold metallo-hydrolase [Oscillospiraceae bacterium]